MFLPRMLEAAASQCDALRGVLLEICSEGIFTGDGNDDKILKCMRAIDELETLIVDKRFRGLTKKIHT